VVLGSNPAEGTAYSQFFVCVVVVPYTPFLQPPRKRYRYVTHTSCSLPGQHTHPHLLLYPLFLQSLFFLAQLALGATGSDSRGRSKSDKRKKQVGKLAGAERQKGDVLVAVICCYLTARRYFLFPICGNPEPRTQLHMPFFFAQSTPKIRPNRMHMPMWLGFLVWPYGLLSSSRHVYPEPSK
jgi:hypothetical protein